MGQQRWFVVLVIASMVGLVVQAAEKPPEDYQKAMKDLGAFSANIDKAVASEDFETVGKLALSARTAFEVVEAYWKGKAEDAFELASTGNKQAFDLMAVATQKSKEGAEYSTSEIKATCGACHMAHREAQPDGSFLIK